MFRSPTLEARGEITACPFAGRPVALSALPMLLESSLRRVGANTTRLLGFNHRSQALKSSACLCADLFFVACAELEKGLVGERTILREILDDALVKLDCFRELVLKTLPLPGQTALERGGPRRHLGDPDQRGCSLNSLSFRHHVEQVDLPLGNLICILGGENCPRICDNNPHTFGWTMRTEEQESLSYLE